MDSKLKKVMPSIYKQPVKTLDGPFDNGTVLDLDRSVRSLCRSLYIEQLELVEPVKTIAAPNHLLETKTYAKVGKNELVHAKPSAIHFEGFHINQRQVKVLKLLNASSEVLRMHIIPPQTRYFNIKYTKQSRMVPGMTLQCTIEFLPDEWRYYYDCVRIHCPGEDNLVIPIHGYPIMNSEGFPRNYTFKPVPVGHSVSEKFPLKSLTPVDFEFSFNYIKDHQAFFLEPMSGIVPANGVTEITVTFSPFEFNTAKMVVELNVSQFNLKAIVCTFTGTSQPGLFKEKTLKILTDPGVLDPKLVSPLDRARSNKQRTKTTITGQQKPPPGPAPMQTLEKDGIRFPAVLDNHHAVAQVLMQEPGKLKASEVKEKFLAQGTSTRASNQQLKEALFEQAVRQNAYEERQNQLRWQVKIGDDPLSAQKRCRILEERFEAMNCYQLKRLGVPDLKGIHKQVETTSAYHRTMRSSNEVTSREELPPADATFDIYSNDIWNVRYAALQKFVQAVWTIIIRNRVDKLIPSLRKLVKQHHEKKHSTFSEGESLVIKSDDYFDAKSAFTVDKIDQFKFPTYVNPNVKDDMAADALGVIPVPPTQVVVKRNVPFFNLTVPQFYKVQGYQKHSSAILQMPTRCIHELRTGAEDEIIKLPIDDFSPCPETSSRNMEDIESPRRRKPAKVKLSHPTLTIPSTMLKPISYPPLQIMNPAPGLQVFLPALAYSEVDSDYQFCPLSTYPPIGPSTDKDSGVLKRSLDREEIIKGVMTWKKFPSQGLTSVSNNPTLTNIWVPRWDGVFNKDLLPVDVPPLLDRLSPEDLECCVDSNEDNNTSCLRPEMITAQFALTDPNKQPEAEKVTGDDGTSSVMEGETFPYGSRLPKTNMPVGAFGQIPKEKREEELEYFITKKSNRLGAKVNARIEELNAKITDDKLILKS